ncbi:hypothetical protein ARMSODRAFT_1008215, partial [Armillaria solidipes]
MDPLRLVHLALLSKTFQRVLMFESSILAWNSAVGHQQNTGADPYDSYMCILYATICPDDSLALVRKPHAET